MGGRRGRVGSYRRVEGGAADGGAAEAVGAALDLSAASAVIAEGETVCAAELGRSEAHR